MVLLYNQESTLLALSQLLNSVCPVLLPPSIFQPFQLQQLWAIPIPIVEVAVLVFAHLECGTEGDVPSAEKEMRTCSPPLSGSIFLLYIALYIAIFNLVQNKLGC